MDEKQKMRTEAKKALHVLGMHEILAICLKEATQRQKDACNKTSQKNWNAICRGIAAASMVIETEMQIPSWQNVSPWEETQ